MAAALSLPFLSIVSAALFVAFVFAVLSLLTQGHVLGFVPLSPVPLWIAVVVLLLVYLAVGGPIGAARRLSQRYANGGRSIGWASSTDGLFWVLLVVLFFYLGSRYMPDVRDWLHQFVPAANGIFI